MSLEDLNDSDIQTLRKLLEFSHRADPERRRALCIEIDINPAELSAIWTLTTHDFVIELIDLLQKRKLETAIYKLSLQLQSSFEGSKDAPQLNAIVRKIKYEKGVNDIPPDSQHQSEIKQLHSKINQLEQQLTLLHSHIFEQSETIQSLQQKLGEKESTKLVNVKKVTKLSQAVELKSDKDIDYTKLRDLLADGKWREADQETADKMLKVIYKDSWKDVTREDIRSFPCEDLHTIDQLWQYYSKSRFGFSIQKKIWQEVGEKVDEETNKKFGDSVGWRKNGRWLHYSKLTFDLDTAPRGHLPVFGFLGKDNILGWEFLLWFMGVRFSEVEVCLLLSYLDSCNLSSLNSSELAITQ
ncbi:hypothetical protein HCG51_34975 (plasmid) [Tolypothrix sp. PCC 7910]|uniref:GUN4 domain-containing protein n=1 Tax=Tolypothrix sp. PCC 7910 TaxID=2099387 RepID=UPI0014277D25|nr:GUN4 domain-containing protein [Tolypothrix sp. PCC 7910]QIR41885.1 hypothetical protein HCG51_34975 [Tolypothrix sp. PCC 7910]